MVPAPALIPSQGAEVYLKLESLQPSGSFKLRGAALRLDALDAAERLRGVVASSAGNHGLGVALAALTLGIRATVFVPETSPAAKRQGIARLGATVVAFGATYDQAEHAARTFSAETGAVFVSPFDDPWVIRGNGGTLAEEILEQRPDARQVVCTVGGGGLAAGLAEILTPAGASIVGVQPRGHCAMSESLRLGKALVEYHGEPTLAGGCEGGVAERTFEACVRHRVTMTLVSEDAIRRAMTFAQDRLGLVVEPTAAVALAGILEGAVPTLVPTVVVVSGGQAPST
ncbi:MAG: pyridoxal-phosphate dependent enzyme [Deltaproteobacteria bacterium]|nr:pyridoxal-phosphate dependent enzyme [Deltaproteobacteria bacterium]